MNLELLTYHAVCKNTDDLEAADELGLLQNPLVKPDHLYTLYPGQSGMANMDNLGRGGYASTEAPFNMVVATDVTNTTTEPAVHRTDTEGLMYMCGVSLLTIYV